MEYAASNFFGGMDPAEAALLAEAAEALIEVVFADVANTIGESVMEHGFFGTPLNGLMDPKNAYVALAKRVGEVAEGLTKDDSFKYVEELTQVAAIAVSMIVGTVFREAGAVEAL